MVLARNRTVLAIAIATILLGGCRAKKPIGYLGHWHGRYRVMRIVDSLAKGPPEPSAWGMSADLQLYVDRFLLRLDGPQQSIDVGGTWTLRADKSGAIRGVTLHTESVDFDGKGGVVRRDPNRAYYDPNAIRKDLSGEIALRQSGPRDKPTALNGVEGGLAGVVGQLELARE